MIKKNKMLTNEFNKSSTNFPQSHDKKKQDDTKNKHTALQIRVKNSKKPHLARDILIFDKDAKKKKSANGAGKTGYPHVQE